MKKLVVLLAATSILTGGMAYAGSGHSSGVAHWSYSGDTGPEHWGQLNEKFKACMEGKNQSPIDIKNTIKAELEPIKVNYESTPAEILNNGHTIQVNMAKGSTITIDNITFELKQFHLHAPSEHRINGESFPMEVHLVHADKNGNLAVIGIMVKEGAANPMLTALWKKMPRKEGDKFTVTDKLSAATLLPTNRDYYRYPGSLTTPPCTEGVRWIVKKYPITASKEQIKEFTDAMSQHPYTNRPVQPVNARPILK